MRARFSIALLTEDGSQSTWRGLEAIVQKFFYLYEDDSRTRRVEFGPAPDNVRPALIANRWESGKLKDDSKKRELWTYLARVISEPGGFVVFHYDGDRPWSQRTMSLRPARFGREVRIRVKQVLSSKGLSVEEIDRRMQRLIECIPFYSVEAWAYQATSQAIDLCQKKYRGADIEKFKEWAADRTRLDEVWKPKDKDTTCLGDAHNEELGKHVPVWEVVRAGCSLMFFVWSLHACPDLVDALKLPP